jgi:hypothetical protein
MEKTSAERILARYLLQPKTRIRTAAFPPAPPNSAESNGESAAKRNIPKDHEFQARALKPLAKALWASTVALGHALTAYRHLSRLKSATVSPDGLMGGRGYVMKLSEMRQKLYEASEALSSISDTIFDEINAPHWKPKLAQLDEGDKEDVARFVEEAQDVMENPEAEAEEQIAEIEAENDEEEDDEKESSSVPEGDAFQPESVARMAPRSKEASAIERPCGMSERAWVHYFYDTAARQEAYAETLDPRRLRQALYVTTANSSQPVSDLPGGPRVNHLGPSAGNGEYGDFSEAETLTPPADDWTADGLGVSRRESEGEDYDYPSAWENELSRSASASVPDSSTDDTPTEGWDFGIGYGARGQGAGGYANPSEEGLGRGVWGPHSGLPGAPPQSTGDTTRVVLDEATNRRAARLALYGQLPQDVAREVARADYYPGAKDNMVSVGTSHVPTPGEAKSEGGQELVNTYYTVEDAETDYRRYDFSTHTLRTPAGDHPGQGHEEPFAADGEATR